MVSILGLKNRAGMSLIEVLVALAVFVIGILAVVRLFPLGFSAVKHSEDITLANRLAQAELERWGSNAANIPAGILAWDQSGVITNTDPGDLYNELPPGGHYYSDANKFRYIYAESTKIPAPSSPEGCMYMLEFSPPVPEDVSPIKVYSGPMKRRLLPSDLRFLDLRSYSEYAIDYSSGKLYVRPLARDARLFYITYSYWVKSSTDDQPKLETVLSRPIFVEAGKGLEGIDIPVDDGGSPVSGISGFLGIDYGSDSLHRAFVKLDYGTAWTEEDPYQFQVKDPVLGLLLFNPHGYNYEEMTTRGKEPLVAYIDYQVLDWHIIREDRKVPTVADADPQVRVKLTLRFIKERGSAQFGSDKLYGGLAPNSNPDYDLDYDVVAVDLETGEKFTERDPTPAFTVDYKNGVLQFDRAYIGRTFRIYYQADGDWAVQAFKAYETYRRGYDPGNLEFRQYYINADTNGVSTDGKVYFSPCYAGTVVAVDYTYRVTENGPSRTVRGDTYHVAAPDSLASGLSYIDICGTEESRKRLGGGDQVELISISRVYGVSLGTRVIWRDSGQGFKAGRWKTVNLHTYLTKTSK